VSSEDRNSAEPDHECEACGAPAARYGVASPESAGPVEVTEFALCPNCATTLVDEIAHGLPDEYLDVLVATVQRRAARRAERTTVAS
jgi:hypothetical protein